MNELEYEQTLLLDNDGLDEVITSVAPSVGVSTDEMLQKMFPELFPTPATATATPTEPIEDEDAPIGTIRVETHGDIKLDKRLERLYRMAQVASKFASTLTLRPIHAEISEEQYGSAPAWSDADNIYFQRHFVGDITTPEGVMSVKGLTLHEISHILLTPRSGTKLVKWVKDNDVWQAFNALEDQRIEMYMTTKFGNVKEWLTATIAKHLLNTPNQIPVSFPLVHGRKYLPYDVRKMVRDSYELRDDVAELSTLIDEYVTLNLGDTSKYTRAQEIIARYHELVNNMPNEQPQNPYSKKGWQRIVDPNGHHSRKEGELKSSEQSKPANKAEQANIIAKMKMGNGSGYEEFGYNDHGQVSDATGIEDDWQAGSGLSKGGADVKLKEILQKVLDDAMQSKSREIETALKQYSGELELSGKALKAPPTPDWVSHRSVPVEIVQASKSFGNELERLQREYDPAWDRRTESGRLNVQRYSTGCDLDEAFDTWNMGREDTTDIECVILLDNSGSMGQVMQQAYENMWAIKRSLDKVGASTTVVTYSNVTRLLYSADEKAGKTVKNAGTGPATMPLKALQYARSVLGQSNRAIKLLITITDGWWDDAHDCNNIIAHLRKAGVLTSLAYMEQVPEWKLKHAHEYNIKIDSHGCEVAVHVAEPRDLFTLAKRMVRAGIARNLRS